jgi:hypothetical protein
MTSTDTQTMDLLDAFASAPANIVTAAAELGRTIKLARVFMPGQGQEAYDWAAGVADRLANGEPTIAGPGVKSRLAVIGTWIEHPMVAQAIADAVDGI